MTAQQIDTFFRGYADAFSRLDVDAVCRHWAYPAYFVYRGVRAALNEAEFATNTKNLCRFCASQKMARATKSMLEIVHITATTAAVRTGDAVFDHGGAPIAAWEHGYLLSDTPQGLKVICAMPDNELDAWGDRWPGSEHLPQRLA